MVRVFTNVVEEGYNMLSAVSNRIMRAVGKAVVDVSGKAAADPIERILSGKASDWLLHRMNPYEYLFNPSDKWVSFSVNHTKKGDHLWEKDRELYEYRMTKSEYSMNNIMGIWLHKEKSLVFYESPGWAKADVRKVYQVIDDNKNENKNRRWWKNYNNA